MFGWLGVINDDDADDDDDDKDCEQSRDYETRTTTRSCGTRKRAMHVYSPGVAAARHVQALQCGPLLLILR